jgi:sulfide dehydrogenase [flavocytochrome c] flavoprotein subunit
MSNINRRHFIKAAGGATAAAGLLGVPFIAHSAAKAKVIVIGGGYGGSIAAKYLRKYDPAIEVTLIEKNKLYVSCPFSNEVIGGESNIEDITFTYKGLEEHGIKVVIDEVTDIDAESKKVKVAGGDTLSYDYLVVSPGVSFKWDAIEGYGEEAAKVMPHAWKAGAQTLLLRKQLEAMDDGGLVIISAPPNPFRCPPGPYERSCQIAHYLKHHKPKSKVMILDAKDKFSKQGLFTQGWKARYEGYIEWVKKSDDGKVISVDPESGTVSTEFEEYTPAVANIIPPQKAGLIAERAGLTDDSGWCPVDQGSFESKLLKDVFVIGDSSIAGKMPKSGYAANSQGKVCAAAIAARVNNQDMAQQAYTNTCYSLIAPDYGISVAAVYKLDNGSIVPTNAGLSPIDAPASQRKAEAEYARSWFRNITSDMFG